MPEFQLQQKFLCLLPYLEKTQKIRNGENQLLLSIISPHKAVSTQTVSRWLVQVLIFAGIAISTFTGHSTRVASASKSKALGVPTREILKKRRWSRSSAFQKYYQKEINDCM